MTQADLAEALELSHDMVGRIERGTSAPSFETIDKLCTVLQIPVHSLFTAGLSPNIEGERGKILLSINAVLSRMNEDNLRRASKVLEALGKS